MQTDVGNGTESVPLDGYVENGGLSADFGGLLSATEWLGWLSGAQTGR